jgi:hypothetical protein
MPSRDPVATTWPSDADRGPAPLNVSTSLDLGRLFGEDICSMQRAMQLVV